MKQATSVVLAVLFWATYFVWIGPLTISYASTDVVLLGVALFVGGVLATYFLIKKTFRGKNENN